MKEQFIQPVMFLLVVLFISCLSEEQNSRLPEKEKEKGKITFSLPAPTVSYATIAATENENLLNRLDIYMFNNDEILEYVYDAVTANGSGASRTASVDVTGRTGAKTFYFVANAEDQSAELDNTVIGTTTLSEFREIMTDRQVDLIKASDGLLMAATKTIADVNADLTAADLTVNLRRRVARFDVLNDATVTNFEIKNIMVSNANLRNYLFEDATGTPIKTIETGKLPTAPFTTTDFPNANTATAATGVFYIYPTLLEEGKTEISIEGLFNGITKIYTVSLPATTPIKANYRYILKAKKMDITNITWELAIDEWQDGSEVESAPGDPLFTFSALSRTGGTGGVLDVAAKTYDITAATTPSVLSFRTSSINKLGTTATVVYKYDTDHSSLPGFTVNTPQPVLTYGASYTQDYKIDIPVQTPNKEIDVVITISDVLNPQQKISILIRGRISYPGTKHAAVLFKGKYWAPVNVGATEVDATVLNQASAGSFYQWGRNVPFAYGATISKVAGPLTLAEASNDTNKDKFITSSSSNWVKIDASFTQAMADALWTGANAQAVCPDGWRLPTNTEFATINTAYSTDKYDAATHRLAIPGDIPGETLYLPAAGALASNGDYTNVGLGNYWSSEISGSSVGRLQFSAISSSAGSTGSRGYARSVRCIRAD